MRRGQKILKKIFLSKSGKKISRKCKEIQLKLL